LASVSGAGFDKLTPKQRRFACLYVLQGGNGTKAAELAGYSAPDVAGVRVRLNPKVAELINLLALADARATLPVAIHVLLSIAQDEKAPYSERRKAALDLAKIGANQLVSQGASVAVQVNQGTASGTDPASSVSVVIQNVWTARAQRLSGIASPMPDTSTTIDARALELEPAPGRGGDGAQGPPPL
jgi:phage terminase small subunit